MEADQNENLELKEIAVKPSKDAEVKCEDGAADMNKDPSERDGFLNGQNNAGNGDMTYSHMREYRVQMDILSRVKAGLTKKIWWKLQLWMIILIILIIVIFISLAIRAAVHVDEDENFDRSLFTIPHYFNGSFQMSSNISSTEAQIFQNKLADLYSSSPALGRYFSKAETFTFRNKSAVVEYKLTFVLPEEHLEELSRFTLSREMVQNVFRQFLYDQDPNESGIMFINPVSLKMSSCTAC